MLEKNDKGENRMGIKTSFKRFFDLDDEHEETVDKTANRHADQYQEPRRRKAMIEESPQPLNSGNDKKKKVVELKSVHQQTKMILAEPSRYEEVMMICDHIKNRRTVIVNLHRLSSLEARQVMDFMSGAIFALDGHIQKISADTFICAPEHVDISGVISEIMDDQY